MRVRPPWEGLSQVAALEAQRAHAERSPAAVPAGGEPSDTTPPRPAAREDSGRKPCDRWRWELLAGPATNSQTAKLWFSEF